MQEYNQRYAENWANISRQCRALSGGKCCYPGCQEKATESHHAVYRDKEGLIAGREIPGVHIFPLCDRHHKEAHWPRNWVRSPHSPEFNNRNSPEFYLKLRKGWLSKL